MMNFIDDLANNDMFLTILICILVALVIVFFIVLFCGGKKGKKKPIEEKVSDEPQNETGANLDFDHDEYLKEATAEFELSPMQSFEAVSSEVEVDKVEESPAYKFDDNIVIDSNEMNNFSFDELSKMISEELNNLEKEEQETNNFASEEKEHIQKMEEEIPQVTFVDSFKEVESNIRPVEISKPENLAGMFEKDEKPSVESVLINKEVGKSEDDEIVLPKLAKTEEEETSANQNNEPVIKDENVPLYARFNQESYDINQKD